MNPFLKGLYQFCKYLSRLALWVYYPRTTVLNKERLKFDRPTILITNHPNTLIDALNSASRISMQTFFLANASMFNTPFKNWLFNILYCIPIQRPQDTGGKPLKNDEAFARCDEFLGNGGCLFIAPEGGSEMVRRIRPLKTGVARIGFSAESKNNYQLGLSIQAVCTSYEQPNLFRSKMVVNAAAPIWIKDYRTEYEKDPIGTVRKLTSILEEQMKHLIINTRDEEEDQLVRQLEAVQQSENSVDDKQHFYRTKNLIAQLHSWENREPEAYQNFKEKVFAYQALKQKNNIPESALATFGKSYLGQILLLLISFPVFLFGWINNFLAFYTPYFLYKRTKAHVTYEATIKMLLGLFTIPIFYYLQYQLVDRFFNSPIPLIYLISLPITGYIAWKYKEFASAIFAKLRLKKWHRENPEEVNQLRLTREAILKTLLTNTQRLTHND